MTFSTHSKGEEKMIGMRRVTTALTLMLAVILAGCVDAPPAPTYPAITFQHLNPITLNVSEIKIVNEFKPTLKPPHVEHELPVKIDQSVRTWVKDRLRVSGNNGAVAVVTIKDASAVEEKLAKQGGIKTLITKDQSELYKFNVLVEVKINEISGASGFVTAEATRSKSVPEGITLNQREQAYYDQVEALMRAFDKEMEKNIRNFLGSYIR